MELSKLVNETIIAQDVPKDFAKKKRKQNIEKRIVYHKARIEKYNDYIEKERDHIDSLKLALKRLEWG